MLADNHIKNLISERAYELGFVKIGFAKSEISAKDTLRLKEWIDKGFDADMKWIKNNFEKRRNINSIMEDAKTVISLGYNYYTPFKHHENLPKISRYAWGKDYHKVLKEKLKILSGEIEKQGEGTSCRFFTDDGPVMDKSWAVRAGIGWMGKHTNVINPEYGSWIFLSEIITNLEFEIYDEPIEDLCGSCRICMEACPTEAIVDEYVLDSNFCISYHTIENRGEIPSDIELNGWIFGCDICQDVCPFNKNDRLTSEKTFFKRKVFETNLNSITPEEFRREFTDSPIKRTGYNGLKRNLMRAAKDIFPNRGSAGEKYG